MYNAAWPVGSADRILGIRNAGFSTALVELRSPCGAVYWREEPIGVPKIPQTFLDGVFYLYQSAQEAKAGSKLGGTGFFVGIPSKELSGASYLYAVSNWHVAVNNGFSVLRVNTIEGK